MTTEILVKTQAAQTVATWRTKTTFDQIFTHIPEGFGRVMSYLGQQNIDPAGTPFTLFYQAPDGDSEGDIAMSVPIAIAPDLNANADVVFVQLPAGPSVTVTHKGSYATLGQSYAAVATWIQEHGHSIVGPSREIYLNSPGEVDEGDLLTEIQFPIDADDASVAVS